MTVKPISNTEIRERKRKQANTSQITGTLGLAALGGTALATRPGQKALKAGFAAKGKKVPTRLYAPKKDKNLSNSLTPILATSAGIGSLGSFNFARYTRAEADKGQRIKKNEEHTMDMGTYGEEGIAKAWAPTTNEYNPEAKREKRARNYELGANTVAGAAGASGILRSVQSQKELGAAAKQSRLADGARAAKKRSSGFVEAAGKHDAKSRAYAKKGTKATVAAVGALGAGAAIGSWRKKEFGKSAFGVEHD